MIVFVLRHADRTAGDELSQAGRERAKLLARMLAESGVGIVYHSARCVPRAPSSR